MIFECTKRPNPALFFRRNEDGDPRWGETVLSDPSDYAKAKVVLLGCPQDEGVRRNGGRVGAAAAPDAIRNCFYRLVATAESGFFDLGDTLIQPTLEATHEWHERIVRQLLADNKTLIVLGGGNDISYPDCAACSKISQPAQVLAFNIDAHLDVRQSPVRHSGTPYRMLIEEGLLHGDRFYELGYQPHAVAQSHLEFVRSRGAQAVSQAELSRQRIAPALGQILHHSQASRIFWGIDMDVVNSSEAPGVSAPNALGLSGADLCEIAAIAGAERHTRLFEISEVNPTYDIDQRTARLAAVVMHYFLRSCL